MIIHSDKSYLACIRTRSTNLYRKRCIKTKMNKFSITELWNLAATLVQALRSIHFILSFSCRCRIQLFLELNWYIYRKAHIHFNFNYVSFRMPSSSKAQIINTKCPHEEIKRKANIPRCWCSWGSIVLIIVESVRSWDCTPIELVVHLKFSLFPRRKRRN